MLKLFKISQEVNNDWDTYDSAVVVAENEEEAKLIHPDGFGIPIVKDTLDYDWVNDPAKVTAVFIGILNDNSGYKKGDVVIASFNAG